MSPEQEKQEKVNTIKEENTVLAINWFIMRDMVRTLQQFKSIVLM